VIVHVAQAVLVAIFKVTATGINHKNALAGVGVFLVDDDDAGVFVTDVFNEQQHQDIVLIRTGIHAAAQFVATGLGGGIKLGFFNGYYEVVFYFDLSANRIAGLVENPFNRRE